MHPEMVEYFAQTYQNMDPDRSHRMLAPLSDFGDQRLTTMDENRVDFAVLSLAGPGVQLEKDTKVAVRKARLSFGRCPWL